jgi:hypothetical protein
MTDHRNTINIGRDARNVIIARQQEHVEVEVYSPTNYHIPQNYLSSTQKCKPDIRDVVMEQPTRGRKIPSSK